MKINKAIGAAIGIAAVGYGAYRLMTGEPPKYSGKWFDSVSDDVLNEERETVRIKYCSAGGDFDSAAELQRLLHRFDEALSKRSWRKSRYYDYPVRSEHGWHLPEDD